MATRSYREVPLRAINVQHNRDRFQGNWDRSYLISRWRGNLTALSQKHNLYFVCCRDRIQVYRPAFPDQTLTFAPNLVIEPPVSSDDLYGYIDQDVPHSINRILLDSLGNQEVILIACDDGDVIGYYTDRINRLVATHDEHGQSRGILNDELRPFFHVNVGKSAWGLAVHQEARKIAVSCNTQRVTVFEFALVASDRVEQSALNDGEDASMREASSRAEDRVVELPEADHNIPHVAFCNTGDDADGRFLLATDIVGNMIMYDIDRGSVVRSIRCAYCKTGAVAEHRCLCVDKSHYPHALWGAFWLDRRSFSRQRDVRAATGLGDLSSSQLGKSWALDISRSRHDVPNSSLEYIPGRGTPYENGVVDEDGNDDDDYMDEDISIEEETGILDDSDANSLLAFSPFSQSPSSPPQPVQTNTDSPTAPPGGVSLETTNLTLMQQLEAATTEPSLAPTFWNGFLHPPPALRPEIQAITRRPKRLHYITKSPSTSTAIPACPILQLSIKDITLFQPQRPSDAPSHTNTSSNNNPHSGPTLPPAVFLHDVLWQRIPATVENPFYNSDHLGRMARLSLVAHIPSMGLVIAGSPSGRVAVLSLAQTQVSLQGSGSSRHRAHTGQQHAAAEGGGPAGHSSASLYMYPPHPPSSPSSSASSPSPATPRAKPRSRRGRPSTSTPAHTSAETATAPQAVKTFYSLRIDHILPLKSQELAGDRPERLLLGLAASPVQGMLGRREGDVGRWRVLLMYEDQSLLSYEIWRGGGGGRGGGGRSEILPL